MAWSHMHKPFAAVETRSTTATCMFSSLMYFCSFLMVGSGILSLSYVFKLFRNWESPKTFLAVGQSGFSSSMMQTPSIVIWTAGAGFAKALTSVMSAFVNESNALTALFKAGMATSKSAWASSATALTSADCFASVASSAETFSFTTSASAWSMATCFSMTSASAAFCSSTGANSFNSPRNPSTTALVSASLAQPTSICSIFTSTWPWSSPSFEEYIPIRSK
mmetsp:Transcript_18212/g.47555  ORF Transcript_18212/g.47555 Transcript_18212/m.47555 type:complete len:222 (-) Transcript_18212:1914-2579(-)